MADRYVEVTSRSWRQRMGGSFKGIFFGFLLVAAAVLMQFWNEGRAVRRAKALKEGAATVVPADGSAPLAANEGRLVHFSGEARADGGVLRDVAFGVETGALKLEREVEMFQWQERSRSEERKKLGGGTETVTTYEYETGWSSRSIDSSGFKRPEGHLNPAFPFEPRMWSADPITIGQWRLGPAFVAKLTRSQPLQVGEAERARASERVPGQISLHEGGFYLGWDPLSPEVGDVRVRFKTVPPATVSVVGLQQGGQLVPYTAKVGGSIALLTYGVVAADQMFESAKRGNRNLTWFLRLMGFVVAMIGFRIILKPLSVMADVVPAIGNLVEKGTGLVAAVLAAFVSLVTIALGWFYYRPWIGILLLAAAVALVVWLVRRLRGGAPKRAPAPPPRRPAPPPPPPRPAPPPPPAE